MLQVSKLWARSFNLDHEDVFWEITSLFAPSNRDSDLDQHEIYHYDLFVLRSDAAMGPYEVVGGPLRDAYHFRDIRVSLLTKHRQYFYKLRVVDKRDGSQEEFGPCATQDPEPDLIAREIMAQEDVLFREFVGRRCWLFPVRTFGPRCTCYDRTMGRITRAKHGPCYGTGWLGGYMLPVEIFLHMEPPGKTSIPAAVPGEMQPVDSMARMSSFPPVSPRDIIIESENRRWRVVKVQSTQRLRAVVHQELSLVEVPRTDIEYSIPLSVDAKTVEPAAERNFTNPQNVENDGDLKDILSFWNGKPRGALR